jgi:hypothetical protein
MDPVDTMDTATRERLPRRFDAHTTTPVTANAATASYPLDPRHRTSAGQCSITLKSAKSQNIFFGQIALTVRPTRRFSTARQHMSRDIDHEFRTHKNRPMA